MLSKVLAQLCTVSLLVLAVPLTTAWADAAPDCLDEGGAIPVDNQRVLAMKGSTPNQFVARAHVAGTVGKLYPDEHGHDHFELQIGPGLTDTLEIVYNISFGALPALAPGMNVEACGDYITSDAPTPQYPASPDNAILHWVHRNPKPRGHPSGYLLIEGQLYGQGHGS